MPPVRYDIRFTGQVQGVGFRFTTRSVSGRFEVDGWVRNEPDGSVRCVADGAPGELDRFVAAVQEAMPGLISNVEIQKSPSDQKLSGFSIRY